MTIDAFRTVDSPAAGFLLRRQDFRHLEVRRAEPRFDLVTRLRRAVRGDQREIGCTVATTGPGEVERVIAAAAHVAAGMDLGAALADQNGTRRHRLAVNGHDQPRHAPLAPCGQDAGGHCQLHGRCQNIALADAGADSLAGVPGLGHGATLPAGRGQ